jgi:four helix bundle protein
MTQREMKERTKRYALRIIKLVDALPTSTSVRVIGKQLLRSGTSVGAKYRSACRAKSTADFISELAIVEEEADESIYWMELLVDSGVVKRSRLASLMDEADQILAIVVGSIKTLKRKRYPKSEIPNPKSK